MKAKDSSNSMFSTSESLPRVYIKEDKSKSEEIDLSDAIGNYLHEIIYENTPSLFSRLQIEDREDEKQEEKEADVFRVSYTPPISLSNYIKRIIKYTYLDDSSLILSLIYLNRYLDTQKINLSFQNAHRLILASILVSIKYNEDNFCGNSYYAKVGGVTLQELNFFEVNFLESLI